VTVVVVVRLPRRSEGVGRHFVVVAEVVAEDVEPGAVRIAAERHALPVPGAAREARSAAPPLAFAADLATRRIDHGLPFAVQDAGAVATGIAGVEVQPAVGAEHHRMEAVVAVDAAEAVEQHLGRARGFVARGVDGVDEHLRRLGDVDLVPQHADAERRHELRVLDEDLVAVAHAGALGVLEDDDSVALGAQHGLPVVHPFGHPHAAPLVDVHVGGVDHAGLASPGRERQTGRQDERLLNLLGGLHAGAGLVLRREEQEQR